MRGACNVHESVWDENMQDWIRHADLCADLLRIHAMSCNLGVLIVWRQVADMATHHVQHCPLVGDALPIQGCDALNKVVVDMIDKSGRVCACAQMMISCF